MIFTPEPRHRKILLLVFSAFLLAGIIFLVALIITDPEKNLTIVESGFKTTDTGQRVFSGTVENKTADEAYSQVKVNVQFLDEKGEVVGNTSTTTEMVSPREAWQFETPAAPENSVQFKANVSSPDNVRPQWLRGCLGKSCEKKAK